MDTGGEGEFSMNWESCISIYILLLWLSCFSRVRLCDPIDGSPAGSPVPGIFQARTLEWVCHFPLQCMKVKSESEVTQSCPTLSDPMDCSRPGSSVRGIFQARVWSGVPLPSPYIHYHVSPCSTWSSAQCSVMTQRGGWGCVRETRRRGICII